MLHVERFINQMMSSNCYLVVDEESMHCLCIDPASEKSEREIAYIEEKGLTLDYVILTHEHTDHTWGVNALIAQYPKVVVICSELCKKNLSKEFQAYFLLYYDNPDYHYQVCQVDKTVEELNGLLEWEKHTVVFFPTPGHSVGSTSISLEGILFTGDAIMLAKPYINKRNGSKKLFFESVKKILKSYHADTVVYPGHGESFKMKEYKDFISNHKF